jgi:very-short-patch-repair endonuclease
MEAPTLTRKRAHAFRRALTPPEARLWVALRCKTLSHLKFRRQHPIGPFILDFYCDRARLAVEVDGEGHGFGDRFNRDERRDRWCERRGPRTLRIPAVDVRDNLDGVIAMILGTIGV